MSSTYRDLFVSADDGLRLYARDYGVTIGGSMPVVCLPGLARTSEDFHDLAAALSSDPDRPRRVLALDYRGRGRSDWDPDWSHYEVRVEANDVLKVLAATGIEKAVFIGTSRGGLITMALNALRPALLGGVVLNDVGPVIEPKGLIRIRGYIGKLPTPLTLADGAQILRRMSEAQFPRFTDEQWEQQARGTWRDKDGQLVLNYDPNLMKPLETLDLDAPLPDLWPLFEGLAAIPVLAIRGEHSDLLTAETLKAMEERHPGLTAITVPGQGHAPALDGELIPAIKQFVAGIRPDLGTSVSI